MRILSTKSSIDFVVFLMMAIENVSNVMGGRNADLCVAKGGNNAHTNSISVIECIQDTFCFDKISVIWYPCFSFLPHFIIKGEKQYKYFCFYIKSDLLRNVQRKKVMHVGMIMFQLKKNIYSQHCS